MKMRTCDVGFTLRIKTICITNESDEPMTYCIKYYPATYKGHMAEWQSHVPHKWEVACGIES